MAQDNAAEVRLLRPVNAATQSVREVGYTATSSGLSFWGALDDEETPELRWPQSIAVYDRMRRQDAQVVSVLRAVWLPVQSTAWRIDPNGARDEVVQHVAEDLNLPVKGQVDAPPTLRTRDRFTWHEHLRMVGLFLPYGHMFFEQIYRLDEQGRARLRKLGPRMPRTIAKINVDADGGLNSIEQYAPAGARKPGTVRIDVNRLVAYVHEREGGNWLGTSLLRAAYKNWLLKDRLLRVQTQTIERNGMGIPMYYGAEGEGEAGLDRGERLARNVQAGATAGGSAPYGAILKLQGVEGTLPDAEAVVRWHDEQIARAVLAHFLNLGTQTGSWALGSTFADFFTQSLQSIAQQVADTASQHLVEDMVDVNFGPTEPAPRIVFDPIGSRQQATAAALAQLLAAGALSNDPSLEQAIRQDFGLPPRTAAPPSAPAPTSEGDPS